MADLQLFRLSLPMRILGALVDPLKRMLVPLRADRYKRYAMRATGLSDFGDDPSFEERYATACRLLNGQNLNVFGRGVLREMMRWHLVNRLTTVDLMKQLKNKCVFSVI